MGDEVKINNDDVFAEAFDKLAELGREKDVVPKLAADPPASPTPSAGAGDGAVADGAVAAIGGEDGGVSADLEKPPADELKSGGAGESPAEPAEPAVPKSEPALAEPAPRLSDEEILARMREMELIRAKGQQQPEPQPQQPQPQFTPDELAILQNYEKEWPDVAKAETLRLRAFGQNLASYIFQEVAAAIQQRDEALAPVLNTVHTIAERTQLNDLHQAVPNYDDVRSKVIDWVKEQPTYLQPAYQYVIQKGTVEEVADLISKYETSTGQKAAPAPTPKPADLAPAVKKAAAALAPVSTKRSSFTPPPDPGDFSAAFEAFAKEA